MIARNNPLIAKLGHWADLTLDDRAALERLVARPRQEMPAHKELVGEGAKCSTAYLVLEGLGCRYRLLGDGRRQITAYLVPGDISNSPLSALGKMTDPGAMLSPHGVAALTRCTVVGIPCEKLQELAASSPRIGAALWSSALAEEGTLYEWLVGLGRRTAEERMAHLLCELLARLQAVSRAAMNSCRLEISQEALGDTLGMSTVHVNRTLQALRQDGLITLKSRTLTVSNLERLQEVAGFDALYLRLPQKKAPAMAGRTASAPPTYPRLPLSRAATSGTGPGVLPRHMALHATPRIEPRAA